MTEALKYIPNGQTNLTVNRQQHAYNTCCCGLEEIERYQMLATRPYWHGK